MTKKKKQEAKAAESEKIIIPQELTQAQIDKLPEYRDKWLAIGLNQDPVDFPKAVEYATMSYERVDLPAPTFFFESRGPLMNAFMACFIRNIPNGLEALNWDKPLMHECIVTYEGRRYRVEDLDLSQDKVWIKAWSRNPRANLPTEVIKVSVAEVEPVGETVPELEIFRRSLVYLQDQIEDRYPDTFYPDRLDCPDRKSQEAWAKDPWKVMVDEATEHLKRQLFGSHDASWLAYFDFFYNECDVKTIEKLRGLIEIAKYCGWWLAMSQVAFVSDRHCELHLDDQERLHNTEGPAVAYPDGYALWEIENQRVTKQIVMAPETQEIDQLLYEPNEEIKRIRITRYGWKNFLANAGAKTLDFREYIHPIDFKVDEGVPEESITEQEWKELFAQTKVSEQTTLDPNTPGYSKRQIELLVQVPGQDIVCLVCGCPSSGNMFFLEVPPTTKTCKEAQRYLHTGSVTDELLGLEDGPDTVGRT